MVRQTFSDVAGMSIWVMPSELSASTTAFMIAASAPTFATLNTQRAGPGRHRILVHLKLADLDGARQAVIRQRAGNELARVRVMDEMLGEGLADALHAAAVDLASECELVDDRADIVDDDVDQHLGGAGFGVDHHLADMTAIGEVRDLGREAGDLVEPGLDLGR